MKTIAVCTSVLALTWLVSGACVQAQEAEFSLKMRSAAQAPGGPSEVFVYRSKGDPNSAHPSRNSFGKFVIGPDDREGTADYFWRGKKHVDTLKYLGRAFVEDKRRDTESEVNGWLYEASDGRNTWYLFFGEDEMRTYGNDLYPVFYSFDRKVFKRWLTSSGTRRS